MKTVYFKCTFKADIVLNSKTSTEGKNSPLDYIPGNVFLGIVAKKYKDYGDNVFDVFHSGKVRFNDATLLINGKESYKIPFSYFNPKGDDNNIYVHHKISEDLFKELREKGIQLKQKRNGYINEDGNYLDIVSVYHQKSAYDKTTRKSKDSQMFGYNAIKRGTEFLFSIDFDKDIDENLKEQIVKDLIGNKFIGKSKTAQYGKVFIEKSKTAQYGKVFIEKSSFDFESLSHQENGEEIILYAKSNLAFIDKNGMPTAQPSVENLGFKSGKILWNKSQIRTRRYTPYNGARKTFDYERMIIEKGSVFVLETNNSFDVNLLKDGVGIYKNEGFGQVLINPSFLMDLNPKFNPNPEALEGRSVEIYGFDGKEDKDLIKWVTFKKKEELERYELLKEVNKFLTVAHFNKLKEPSLSQWGQIRSISSSHKNTDRKNLYQKLFDEAPEREEDKGFLVHGSSKDKWKTSIHLLLGKYDASNELKVADFYELLSIEVMRKIKANIKEDK